jgi:hypothetical protein
MDAPVRNPLVRAISATAAMSSAVPMHLAGIPVTASGPGRSRAYDVVDRCGPADDQHGLAFQGRHLFSFDGIILAVANG